MGSYTRFWLFANVKSDNLARIKEDISSHLIKVAFLMHLSGLYVESVIRTARLMPEKTLSLDIHGLREI